MLYPLILASSSKIRADLLHRAGVKFDVVSASIDEKALRHQMQQEYLEPEQMAQALASAKGEKISLLHPNATVIGADQILLFDSEVLEKPATPEIAIAQIKALQGKCHDLISAVAIVENGTTIWHFHDRVTLEMRKLSDNFICSYVAQEWSKIRTTVGCYMIEDKGIGLFKSIKGDYHAILGLPILGLLSYLEDRGIYKL